MKKKNKSQIIKGMLKEKTHTVNHIIDAVVKKMKLEDSVETRKRLRTETYVIRHSQLKNGEDVALVTEKKIIKI